MKQGRRRLRAGWAKGPPTPPLLFEILKACPSKISTPMIPFRFLHLHLTINTKTNLQTNVYVLYYAFDDCNY